MERVTVFNGNLKSNIPGLKATMREKKKRVAKIRGLPKSIL